MVDRGMTILGGLAVLLIIVVYFTGFSTDATTIGSVLAQLGNVFTGRNSQGQFAGYPSGTSGGKTAQRQHSPGQA